MQMRKYQIFLFTIFFSLVLMSQKVKNTSLADSITIAELRDHMFFLASDELGGRVVGTDGFKIASDYVVSQLKSAGINPLIKNKESGTLGFLQPVPFIEKKISVTEPMVIKTHLGEFKLRNRQDFKLAFYGCDKGNNISLEPVFIGYGIKEEKYGWNDLKGLDLKGKLAVMINGAPIRDGKPVLPETIHKAYINKISGFERKFAPLISLQPAGIIIISANPDKQDWLKTRDITKRTQLRLKRTSARSQRCLPNLFALNYEASLMLFKNQEYSPFMIKNRGINGYKTFSFKNSKITYNIESIQKEILSWNIVGIVEGKDPVLKKEYISLGAHLDHLPPRNGQVCNGADDNASGVIGVLEIAEVLALNPPKRSVMFILYTAEESGILGSAYFINHSPISLDQIKVNINIDMIGRTNEKFKNREEYVIGFERSWFNLKQTISRVNQETVQWPLAFVAQKDTYGNSDHTSFNRANIPAVNFWDGRHQDWHQPTDDIEKIDFEKMQKLSQLIYHVIMELGNK